MRFFIGSLLARGGYRQAPCVPSRGEISGAPRDRPVTPGGQRPPVLRLGQRHLCRRRGPWPWATGAVQAQPIRVRRLPEPGRRVGADAGHGPLVAALSVEQAPLLVSHRVPRPRVTNARLPVPLHSLRGRLAGAAATHRTEPLTLATDRTLGDLPLREDVAVRAQLLQRILAPLSIRATTEALGVLVDALRRQPPLPTTQPLRRVPVP